MVREESERENGSRDSIPLGKIPNSIDSQDHDTDKTLVDLAKSFVEELLPSE